jgi:diguanylate cyclase (GGDEF)-like protein
MRGIRSWISLTAAVAVVAGAVLFAARTQQQTSARNFGESQVASSMLIAMLAQERGLDAFLSTGRSTLLQPYFEGGRVLTSELDHARSVSADDGKELATVGHQKEAFGRWRGLARTQIASVEVGRPGTRLVADERQRQVQLDAFIAANTAYQARLDVVRRREERGAALVPVWLILGLSVLFAGVGSLFIARSRRVRSGLADREAQARGAEIALTSTQARFAEAMQVSESQAEAHTVLAQHLERTIPDSSVIVLNRNNSADRLEPSKPLPSGHPLFDPLQESKPRSCMAVRLNRQYEHSGTNSEILNCEICGTLTTSSTCQPLLVGGEVIGSVLVSHKEELSLNGRRRLVESVSQAAPVLANLRNLKLAESRAATDVLTGLPNRRSVDDSLKRMLAQAGRAVSPLSIALLDLDHFKQINDTLGHERGDDVLAAFGALVRGEIRASDLAGRTGGEEFAILLPDTDRASAIILADKVRTALHRLRVKGVDRPITASFGVATFPNDATDAATLMRIADRALYTAKQQGRDRIETATPARLGPSARIEAAETHPIQPDAAPSEELLSAVVPTGHDRTS